MARKLKGAGLRSGYTKLCFKAGGSNSRRLITPEQFRDLMDSQQARCAICKKLAVDCLRCTLCVDHDHATGRIRGLLCTHCNTGLGFFKDSPEVLVAASKYLELTKETDG